MSDFIDAYIKDPNITTLAKLLIKDLNCEFTLIAWYISHNYWYISMIYDKQIDDCIQQLGWYLLEEPNEKNIPIRHAILHNTYEIKTTTAKILMSGKEPIIISPTKSFIILSFLEKLALTDLLNRQRMRQELMLSNISHSIRTPLNGILHMTKIINEYKLNDDIREATQYLNKSSVSLANNIFDIIDINKLELGKVQLNKELFNIREFLLDNVLTFANTLNKSTDVLIHYYIDPSVPEYIYSDPKRIKQILVNLIENSLQHTYKGEICLYASSTLVNLEAEVNETYEANDFQHYITFTISDTGTGIDLESQAALFKPPELICNSKQKGLSLRISYLLAKLLNGSLKLINTNTTGSCFEFSMISNDSYAETVQKVLDISEIRVLVVEDEHINRIVMEKILRQLGFIAITMASNGKMALDKYKKSIFDIVLIDIRMPHMSGFELAELLHDINPDIKMIGVTAQVILEDGLKPWFKDFVYKPIDSAILKKMILKYLQ